MRKFLLALGLWLLTSPAFAQNHTCATRPNGDSSNACASTAFVQNSIVAADAPMTAFYEWCGIGDKASHPLSTVTSCKGYNTTGWTLAQWQTLLPAATDLTDEVDWAAIQSYINSKGTLPIDLYIPSAYINHPISACGYVTLRGMNQADTFISLTASYQDGIQWCASPASIADAYIAVRDMHFECRAYYQCNYAININGANVIARPRVEISRILVDSATLTYPTLVIGGLTTGIGWQMQTTVTSPYTINDLGTYHINAGTNQLIGATTYTVSLGGVTVATGNGYVSRANGDFVNGGLAFTATSFTSGTKIPTGTPPWIGGVYCYNCSVNIFEHVRVYNGVTLIPRPSYAFNFAGSAFGQMSGYYMNDLQGSYVETCFEFPGGSEGIRIIQSDCAVALDHYAVNYSVVANGINEMLLKDHEGPVYRSGFIQKSVPASHPGIAQFNFLNSWMLIQSKPTFPPRSYWSSPTTAVNDRTLGDYSPYNCVTAGPIYCAFDFRGAKYSDVYSNMFLDAETTTSVFSDLLSYENNCWQDKIHHNSFKSSVAANSPSNSWIHEDCLEFSEDHNQFSGTSVGPVPAQVVDAPTYTTTGDSQWSDIHTYEISDGNCYNVPYYDTPTEGLRGQSRVVRCSRTKALNVNGGGVGVIDFSADLPFTFGSRMDIMGLVNLSSAQCTDALTYTSKTSTSITFLAAGCAGKAISVQYTIQGY